MGMDEGDWNAWKNWPDSPYLIQMQNVGIALMASVFAENDEFPFPILQWVT